MKQIFVIFTFLLTIDQNSSLDFVESKLGWTCSNNFECSTRHSCPYWAEKDVELNQLKRGSSAKNKMIEEYKSAICNKKEKGLCCPRPTDIVKSSDKKCPSDRWCTVAESCNFWKEKRGRLRGLSRWTMDYKNLKEEIISAICNKKKKALCCPKVEKRKTVIIKQTRTTIKKVPINTSPTYLPIAGNCGSNPQKTPAKVFGGNTTNAGDFPFAALLGKAVMRQTNIFYRGTRAPMHKSASWVCGGTLINYWYVITAAHCTVGLTYLRLGEWTVGGLGSREHCSADKLLPVQEFKIRPEDIIVHEGYRKKFRDIENDIALIRLPRKPKLNAGVQFACLPLPEATQRVGMWNWDAGVNGREATVIGWGYSCYENNSRSFCKDQHIGNKKQQYLEVPVIPNTSCKKHGLTLSPNQLCAGGEKGKGSCQGDSGGGLFMRKGENGADGDVESPWYLLGIVSYGQPACGMGIPDVYTRVSKYVDWIKIKIRQ